MRMTALIDLRWTRRILLAATLLGAGSLAGCGTSLNSTFASLDGPKVDGASFSGDTGSVEPKIDAEKKPASARKAGPAATRVADGLTAAATPGNAGYKIGPQDMLEFSVFKAPELQRVAQVSEEGTINLPLIGEIPASGRTATELERDVAQRLGKKYLQNPQVTIVVREYNSQRVTLEGAIKKPGVYPLKGKTTLLQAVATAEGFSDLAEQTVVIFRQTNGQRTAAKFDITEIRSGSATDPVLQAGDTIVASNSVAKETFQTILKALPLATVFALL
ncbi:MAG: polysaccharide export protein [Hyphomicrobiales bacterium]|nr:MAG: polysaccharide export protein [Hyphomicrobiales bacterium]